ncbi:MFS transporter [bacterium]|nr:MFS transporter [bacterium]
MTDRRTIDAWCLYDWANSAFACTVMAALFPPFFRTIAENDGLAPAEATARWGVVTALALLTVAVSGPLVGAIADARARRKQFLTGFMLVGVLATAGFALLPGASWPLAGLVFVIANIGFAGSIVFYESLLPAVAGPDRADEVSARGYAWGYLGGGVLLVINMLWVTMPERFGLDGTGQAVQLSFVSVAVWWLVFSLPLLRRVPEPPREPGAVMGGFARLARTWGEVRRLRPLLVFLVAYWIYNDGIGTIIKMATAYGGEIGIETSDMIQALVLTQFVAWPSSLAFGRLARRFRARPVLMAGLFVYAGICVLGFFMTTAWHFFVLAGLVGTVQGGCQALSRSIFASMVPPGRTGEFFGFYATSGKLAGIAGPLVFAIVSQTLGDSRLSILVLVVFFLVGAWLLARVDLEAGRQLARAQPVER